MLFPEPAVDIVGKAIVGRGHYDVWRSRVRGIPEFAGELPVSTLREEIETPGEGQIRAMLTVAGNPVLSTPDGRRLGEALAGLDFMAAVDIYLNETTRHARRRAAADHRPGARPVRPRLPHPGRAQHRAVHSAGLRQARGRHARLGDLPRDRAAHHAPGSAKKKTMAKALTERVSLSVSPATSSPRCCSPGGVRRCARCASHPEGVDLGPLQADDARRACRPGTS